MQHGAAGVNKLKLLFWTVLSSLVGFSIGNIIIQEYDANTFHPWTWKQPPVVVNCYGEDLDELHIVQAVHYWIMLGEKFAFNEQNPSDKVCSHDYIHGFILIKKKDLHY